MVSRTPLFRRQALEFYAQSREKTILPRLTRPPVFLLLWLLLSLTVIALVVTWLVRIPVYASGSGIIIEQTALHQQQMVHTAVALVFLPLTPGHIIPVRTGTPAYIQLGNGAQEQQITGQVAMVVAGPLSPDEIEQRYHLAGKGLELATGPSVVVRIDLGPTFSAQAYAGSLLHTQVQIGSISVLSSLFSSTQAVGV